MLDWTAYSQGRMAGYRDEDSRSCPYESTNLVISWLEGWYEGQDMIERDSNNGNIPQD